jgi:Ca2+-binding EF-hand superfamily protein
MAPRTSILTCVLGCALLVAPSTPQEDSADRAHRKAMRYFDMCDYDEDGAVVYKEAKQSLRLDRDQFRGYDRDRDGVISADEFEARYRVLSVRAGGFEPPRPKPSMPVQPNLTPGELIANYDVNRDGGLSMREVDRALHDFLRSELDAEFLLEKLDADRSRRIDSKEIADLLRVLNPASSARGEPAVKRSVVDLFGEHISRETERGALPLPPRIIGPVPHFTRLDLDGDGRISGEDLSGLKRPLQLPMRIRTLLSYLDEDGDGALSEAEFFGSMGF